MRKLQTLLFLMIVLSHGFAGGAYAQSAAVATGWSALVAGIAKSPAFLMRNAAGSPSIGQVN